MREVLEQLPFCVRRLAGVVALILLMQHLLLSEKKGEKRKHADDKKGTWQKGPCVQSKSREGVSEKGCLL